MVPAMASDGSAAGSPVNTAVAGMRARGYRMTPQRRLILETVYRAREHVTAETVLSAVRRRFPDVNLSTVYRNLEMLEDLGYVSHSHLGHTPGMYHAVDRPGHQHLVCRRCGKVDEIPVESLASVRDTIREQRGFEVDVTHFAMFGLCRRCR